MKSKLKAVNTQRELGILIQQLSKDGCVSDTAKYTGILSVNDGASVAKVISNVVKTTKYNDLHNNLFEAIYSDVCKIKSGKEPMAMEVLSLIFKDSGRWYWFSQSKKMMRRVIKNDKTPLI